MRALFATIRFYPIWAIPLSFVLLELGLFLKRKRNPSRFACFAAAGLFFASSFVWFYMRGDLYSDRWVRALFY